MEKIDQSVWPRREAYEMFSKMEYPFYSVTVPLDVTDIFSYTRQKGLSFYYTMVWLCTKAANSVPQLLLRIRGEDVVRIDAASPSFTDLKKGSEQFHIVTLPWTENPALFCRRAAKQSARQNTFLLSELETDELIYFSCTPWFDFTALTNERSFDRDDTIPRLAWGKYREENGRLLLHLSIDVNHRTVDGLHLAQLLQAIERETALLKDAP